MPTFSLVINAILLVIGCWWCKEVFGRWRDDVAELKTSSDRMRKAVTVGIWLFTVGIIVLIARFALGIVANLINAFR